MPVRISTVVQTYAGVPRTVGERFEVPAADVANLLALGRIQPEEGELGFVDSVRESVETITVWPGAVPLEPLNTMPPYSGRPRRIV